MSIISAVCFRYVLYTWSAFSVYSVYSANKIMKIITFAFIFQFLYRVRSLALQPLSAGNSAEFSQADNSKTIQPREINLTSLDSLGFCESIYVYFKPKQPTET